MKHVGFFPTVARMESKIDTKWFVDRLADRKLSQRGLARHLGLDSSAISLTFRGKRQMKLTEAAEIARLIGAPLEEVLKHAGVHEATGGAKAALGRYIDDTGEIRPTEEDLTVDAPPNLPDGCVAIQSRAGDHTDGWLYFLKLPSGINPEAMGRFSAVRVKNGVTTLALVSRSYQPGRYRLSGVLSADAAELDFAEPIIVIQP